MYYCIKKNKYYILCLTSYFLSSQKSEVTIAGGKFEENGQTKKTEKKGR